jgi:hypothetical protein
MARAAAGRREINPALSSVKMMVHRRRRDAKETRDAGLRGRASIYERIGVDEGEILTLSRAEILWRITVRSIHQESSNP